MIHIVYVEHPIGTRWLAEPLALDNELLAAAVRIRFVTVQVHPLKIRALLLARHSRLIVGIRLIMALRDWSDVIIRVKLASGCK
jgi:hypothetical protein